MRRTTCNRRGFLGRAGAAMLTLAAIDGRADVPVTVGVLYAGARTDFGFNQSHAEAARRLSVLPDVRVVEVEADEPDLPAAAGTLAGTDRCDLVFVTSPAVGVPELLAQADAYRGTAFLLCGAAADPAHLPPNVAIYGAFIDDAQHVAGIVAGYAARGGSIGFLATTPGAAVLRSVNAFALGARRADPRATIRLLFIGERATPGEARAAAGLLAAGGVGVLAGHLPGLRPVCEAAEAAGIQCCGLHVDLAAFAPSGYLTGAEWDWSRAYEGFVRAVRDKAPVPHGVRGGFGGGLVRCSPYGPGVTPEARAHAEAARFQLANGNAQVFRGPITDNTGRLVVPKGAVLVAGDAALDRMVWLADGVAEVSR